jgi:hypothetical protein
MSLRWMPTTYPSTRSSCASPAIVAIGAGLADEHLDLAIATGAALAVLIAPPSISSAGGLPPARL